MIKIPYGDGYLDMQLPWAQVEVVQPVKFPAPISDIAQQLQYFATEIAESHPPDREIVIVFTDATRASPDQVLIEPLLQIFQQYNRQVTLLCAIGMHRPSTNSEKRDKLGNWIVDNFRVIDHDPAQAVQIAVIDDVPVTVNPLLKDALIISTGVVEPHQYAGYSGGYKTVVIGCGGPETIAMTHGPLFLNMPGTRLANMQHNPFQAFVRKAGQRIGHDYAVNVITDASVNVIQMHYGKPDIVHDYLIKTGKSLFEAPVQHTTYDVVIAGVGAPKDANLYQASRAATYVGLSATPVLRDGGVIVLVAQLPEGAGQGKGEQNAFQLLQKFGPTDALITHLLENDSRPGEQRAFMIAQLIQRYRLIVVGAETPDIVNAAGIEHVSTMQGLNDMINIQNPKVLVVPHAIRTIPVPTDSIQN